ncbi:hypothetical protein ACS0TY_029206 [Phlomoides rotata]
MMVMRGQHWRRCKITDGNVRSAMATRGCSTTVLLPDKVVHALNLNLDSTDAQPHLKCNRNFTPEYGIKDAHWTTCKGYIS